MDGVPAAQVGPGRKKRRAVFETLDQPARHLHQLVTLVLQIAAERGPVFGRVGEEVPIERGRRHRGDGLNPVPTGAPQRDGLRIDEDAS